MLSFITTPPRGKTLLVSAAAILGSLALFLGGCGGSGQRADSGSTNGPPPASSSEPSSQQQTFIGDVIVPPVPAQPLELTDQDGKKVRLSDYKSKYVLLSFVYQGCPDICPRVANSVTGVEKAFADQLGTKLVTVLISIDPEGDTAEGAKAWTEAFGGRWRYLLGSRSQLEKVWDDYGMIVEKTSDGGVGHAVKTYIIDPQSLIRIRYGGVGWENAAISDLEGLMGN